MFTNLHSQNHLLQTPKHIAKKTQYKYDIKLQLFAFFKKTIKFQIKHRDQTNKLSLISLITILILLLLVIFAIFSSFTNSVDHQHISNEFQALNNQANDESKRSVIVPDIDDGACSVSINNACMIQTHGDSEQLQSEKQSSDGSCSADVMDGSCEISPENNELVQSCAVISDEANSENVVCTENNSNIQKKIKQTTKDENYTPRLIRRSIAIDGKNTVKKKNSTHKSAIAKIDEIRKRVQNTFQMFTSEKIKQKQSGSKYLSFSKGFLNRYMFNKNRLHRDL